MKKQKKENLKKMPSRGWQAHAPITQRKLKINRLGNEQNSEKLAKKKCERNPRWVNARHKGKRFLTGGP